MENIKFENNTDSGNSNILAIEDSNEVGRIEYQLTTTEMVVEHTEVHPDKRGTDLAKTLVVKALDFSKEKNLKIKSTCPYAKKVLNEIK
ncbi:GNAT family N-acetyltransferase [Litoribacter populi]|uniref:GNAT family N-acetyltransferase n=1 Tax=Litoribacter populi TaxID=2598460 RepID=UPI00117F2A7E|nr:GNAT family N-acetyltransferase [Litoribacter populi]